MSRRPIDATTGLTRTRSAMGDGTVRGKARIATPHDRRRLRGPTRSGSGAAAAGTSATPLGHTVTVEALAVAGTGKVEWDQVVRGSGFITTLPDPQVRIRGYYDVDVAIDAGGQVMRDVQVTATIGELVVTAACPFATAWAGTIPDVLGERGDQVTIEVSWTGAATVDVTMTVGLDEPLATLIVERPPPCCFERIGTNTGAADSLMPASPAGTENGLGDRLPDGRVGFAWYSGGAIKVGYAPDVSSFVGAWPSVVFDRDLITGLTSESGATASFSVIGSDCYVLASYKTVDGVNESAHAALWKSTDAGVTWGPRIDLSVATDDDFGVNSMCAPGIVHRLESGTLLAGAQSAERYTVGGSSKVNSYAGIYRSTDDGATWTLVREGKDGPVGGGYVSTSPSGFVEADGTIACAYMGLYAGGNFYQLKSTDDGATWTLTANLQDGGAITSATAIGPPCGDDGYAYMMTGPDRGELPDDPCASGNNPNAVRLRHFNGPDDHGVGVLVTTIPDPGLLGTVAIDRNASRISLWGGLSVIQVGGWVWHASSEGV